MADLTFRALPSDYVARRDAGLAPYAVLPFFDPILVDPTRIADPKEILDGHQALGHFDRVTQAFSVVNILGVGLPKRTFHMDDLLGWEDGGGITVTQTETPLRAVQINLSAEWLQRFDGELTATGAVKALFPSGYVETLTGDELERSWFKRGEAVKGSSGYTVTRSRLQEIAVPFGSPAKVGPVHGLKARFNYVDDPNFQNPQGMSLPVAYYDLELVVAYSVSQKRVEHVSILMSNTGQGAEDGEVRTLDLRAQDVAADNTTPPFIGLLHYPFGYVVRVGATCYRCAVEHDAKAEFAADLYRIDNGILVPQWMPLPNDASAIGGADRATYAHTNRGLQTIFAAILKGVRLLAESSRCVDVEFHVPFEDVLDMGTAWMAELVVDDDLVPGGWCEGKVTSFKVSDPSNDAIAKASITIRPAAGGGQAPPPGSASVAYTAEPWDKVTIGSYAGQIPAAFPAPGGNALVINDRAQQLAYVQANDYVKDVAGRNDRTANEPKRLLKQCKTEVVLALVDISPRADMTHDIVIANSGWSGPRQINLPE